jgi:phosphoribosylaminoimidazolecarboxamide formyltransferase/IMP cyclohydrolase
VDRRRIERAVLSVSDKTGIVELARGLVDLGVEILSTGGTARTISEAGILVTQVSDYTESPEMLNGRVKTLHPKVHGGILLRREDQEQVAEASLHGILPIDLVVVNLYPFQRTVSREGVTVQEAIENIDIGGPTMIRSAAKNHESVAVVVDPDEYGPVLVEMRGNGGTLSLATRRRLAISAFRHTADYDIAVHRYLSRALTEGSPAYG